MSSQPPYDYYSQYGGNNQNQQGMYQPSTDPYSQPQQGAYPPPTDPYVQPQAGGYPPNDPYAPSMQQQPGYYQNYQAPQMPLQNPGYYASPYAQPAQDRGRGFAITSLVMGIISIFSAFIPVF